MALIMATGRGINPKSIFTRAAPAAAAELIPNLPDDGQAGYDVRLHPHWGIKLQNNTVGIVAYRILGFTQEDVALAEPVVLKVSANVAANANDYAAGYTPGIAHIQVEITPAGAVAGEVKVVFASRAER